MMLTSAGIFAPQKDAPIYFVPLLQAGPISELLPAEVVYNNLHPAEILRHFEKDSNPKYIAARIISKNMEKPFELIVVGDSDMLYDSFWTVHQTILENNYAIPVLDNANFVLNALDTLLGRDDMINLRGKSGKNRTFEDIETARKLAQQQFKIREKDIIDKIEQTKSGLQEIWGKKTLKKDCNLPLTNLPSSPISAKTSTKAVRSSLISGRRSIRKPVGSKTASNLQTSMPCRC